MAGLVLFVFLATALAAVASAADGPYVLRQSNGNWVAKWVEGDGTAPRVKSEPVSAGRRVTVPAVGALPAFEVPLRSAPSIAPDEVQLGSDAPLFVVADTHGEYQIVAELLKQHRIVDSSLRWSFGRGHLVILGDVFDRGPNQVEILWLIYALEAQAARAGGGVHLVLGNHEVMVLRGDLRYLHPKYTQTATALGVSSYAELFDTSSALGQWLRTKPAVLKVDQLLCLHGGVSRALVDRGFKLADINATVRAVLSEAVPDVAAEKERAEFLTKSLGPLWYRGYFAEHKDFPAATMDDIDRIRSHFGVGKILVGHTAVPTVTPLYDRKVIAVQVYPRRDEAGRVIFEGLLIKDGAYFRAKPDGNAERLN